jgi:hypothetical protein
MLIVAEFANYTTATCARKQNKIKHASQKMGTYAGQQNSPPFTTKNPTKSKNLHNSLPTNKTIFPSKKFYHRRISPSSPITGISPSQKIAADNLFSPTTIAYILYSPAFASSVSLTMQY